VVSVRIRTHRSMQIKGPHPLIMRSTTCSSSQLRKRLVYNPSSLHADVPISLFNSFKIGGKQGALSPCVSLSDLCHSSPDETLDEVW
jgi:hypothetical protein